jgi:hypothetical protein
MSFIVPELAAPLEAFSTALGIGLLVGMERERRPDSAAGLRTFALVAMLGCLFALLGEKTGGPWILAVGCWSFRFDDRRQFLDLAGREISRLSLPKPPSSSLMGWVQPSGSATQHWP